MGQVDAIMWTTNAGGSPSLAEFAGDCRTREFELKDRTHSPSNKPLPGRLSKLVLQEMQPVLRLLRVGALVAAALLGALMLAACDSPTVAEPSPTIAVTVKAEAEPTPTVAEPTPTTVPTAITESEATQVAAIPSNLPVDFQIELYQGQDVLGGQEIKFSELFGQGKPVILNFWAGLCPPCRLEMPDFDEFATEYENEVVLFGLDVGTYTGLGSAEDGKALLDELGISYPVGSTPDATVIAQYEVFGMPATLFIMPDGTVFNSWTGILTKEKLTELAEELLEASRE